MNLLSLESTISTSDVNQFLYLFALSLSVKLVAFNSRKMQPNSLVVFLCLWKFSTPTFGVLVRQQFSCPTPPPSPKEFIGMRLNSHPQSPLHLAVKAVKTRVTRRQS